ncbi:MAG: isocitrate/isopropylmalate dehydrogenase family protein [Synergistaceae bacterium]|jgi:3-isopropylmalate dehydrogenase|nr:isocitrate/isopropylmalate dehydrogenase family protein [Synergistaceae bacterium]
MKSYKIALLPGDGIGPEVTAEAVKAVEAAGSRHGFEVEWVAYPFGAAHYNRTGGETLPDSALNEMGLCDAMLLGAVGDPSVKPGILERGILLKLRFRFDQYINLRPARSYRGVPCPVPLPDGERIDSVVVRENTEDFYMGIGAAAQPGCGDGFAKDGFAEDGFADVPFEAERGLYKLAGRLSAKFEPDCAAALQIGALTRPGIERVTRYAFDLARQRGEKEVVLASKANAVPFLYGFLDEETRRVAKDYAADIALRIQNVDALCYHLVRKPASHGVILCPNLFGDIVSDLLSGLTGGLGLGAGGNIGDGLSMFEPVHGSAPDIAGTGKANPLAAILAAAMMLGHIGESAGAESIDAAVTSCLEKGGGDGGERPFELGGRASCRAVGDAVARRIG